RWVVPRGRTSFECCPSERGGLGINPLRIVAIPVAQWAVAPEAITTVELLSVGRMPGEITDVSLLRDRRNHHSKGQNDATQIPLRDYAHRFTVSVSNPQTLTWY